MSQRSCQTCAGTGSIWRDKYNEMKCWKCVGQGSVVDNSGIDLTKDTPLTHMQGNFLADLRAQGAYNDEK